MGKGAWVNLAYTPPATGASTTNFRINAVGEQISFLFISRQRHHLRLPPAQPANAFQSLLHQPPSPPSPSTLTFTVTNPNSSSLTGVGFTDTLPSGLLIANPSGLTSPVCSTNGSISNQTITAVAGTSTISLSGATLSMVSPATNVSCTFSVNVTGNVAGLYHNVTSNITSTETGPNTTSTGYGTSDLTVTAVPPVINKAFGASSILTNGTTSLKFVITNPNPGTAYTGVTFTDTLPRVGGGNPQRSLQFLRRNATATAGSGSVSLSGVSLGRECLLSVPVNVRGHDSRAQEQLGDGHFHHRRHGKYSHRLHFGEGILSPPSDFPSRSD